MKTLDEVIADLECCNGGFLDDALHYLKDLKNLEEDYDILYKKYWREFEQQQANPVLTWDELKQMEGKPVWVELKSRKAWGLNDGIYIDFLAQEIVTVKVLHDLWHLAKNQMGETWQAYRKERHEDAG